MKNFVVRLIKDDQGQSTTEYILILSVVVMIAMKFKGEFSKKLESLLGNVTGQLDQATKDQ